MAKRGRKPSGWSSENLKSLKTLQVTVRNYRKGKYIPSGYKYKDNINITVEGISEGAVADIFSSTTRAERYEKLEKYGILEKEEEKKTRTWPFIWSDQLKKQADSLLMTDAEYNEVISISKVFEEYYEKIGTKIYKKEVIGKERVADAKANVAEMYDAIADKATDTKTLIEKLKLLNSLINELDYAEKYRIVYDEDDSNDTVKKLGG